MDRFRGRSYFRAPAFAVLQLSAFLLRIPARHALALSPQRAAWLRRIDVLWQPTYGRLWHDVLYRRRVDPYRFGSNPYEAAKYQHTLELVGDRHYERALEIGCAEGIFTELLAPHCGLLVAIDASTVATGRARRRVRGLPHVTATRASIPMEMPAGPFDLIVCSDVLYYLPRDVLTEFAPVLARSLRPGGRLVLLHYLGSFGQPLTGEATHDTVVRHVGLPVAEEITVAGVGPDAAGYRATRFDRPIADAVVPDGDRVLVAARH